MSKALIILTLFLIFGSSCYTQETDSLFIKLHFLYGSKPKHNTKDSEKKRFGGLHGGHVTIEVDETVFGFNPKGSYHIFANNKKPHGAWRAEPLKYWVLDTASEKYTSFIIPVTQEQYDSVKNILTRYVQNTPYDYALFGYRCAAASWDVLSQAGILDEHSRTWEIYGCFIPKPERRKMFRRAEELNAIIVRKEGRNTRKWEKDKRKFR
ncbi:MAG: hypothetical protein C0592_10460 [Marinilabiliales bacterium]|nr:MAG: hypothetical protein C0592_10460 [Marinilabiliales bacterium]